MNRKPRILVACGYGINCQEELAAAWKLADCEAEIIHLNSLFNCEVRLANYDLFCLPGGFSFGDDLGSGKVLAARLKYRKLSDGKPFFVELQNFVENGGYALGICNGFQTLVKLGMLPNLSGTYEQEVSLAHNNSGIFEDRWVRLATPDNSLKEHIWLNDINHIELPVRHGEGRLVCKNRDVLKQIEQRNLILWQYADSSYKVTDCYPLNPNGSQMQIAALADTSGRIIGMMPHPEAFLHNCLHPDHKIKTRTDIEADGLKLFLSLARHIKNQINFQKE